MSKDKESIVYVTKVALLLCVVCSVVISTAAVMLRPMQDANKSLDIKRNILAAAGLMPEGASVEEIFEKVTTRIVDLDAGTYTDAVDPDNYDQRVAARDTAVSYALPREVDTANIGRKEKYAEVYFMTDDAGEEILILPVRGYGLWGTLYGFVAVQSDYNTIVGLGFYEHKETPGLGGEVDNPNWKAIWNGKKLYDESGGVAIQVLKGAVDSGAANAQHKVDGLSGATLTSRGISNLMNFWFGENGYKPFLTNLKKGEA